MKPQERLEKLTESIEKTKEIIRLNKNIDDSTPIDYWELWLDQQEYARKDLVQEIAKESKEMKEGLRTLNTLITYKGYELLVEVVHFIPEKSYNLEKRHIPSGYTTYGGKCKEINFVKGLCLELHELADEFKKAVNEKLKLDKEKIEEPKNKTVNHLRTQLDRLAQRDKEVNFTPFELRGQLIEIYHLFGKILGITLDDIYRYYFERAEK